MSIIELVQCKTIFLFLENGFSWQIKHVEVNLTNIHVCTTPETETFQRVSADMPCWNKIVWKCKLSHHHPSPLQVGTHKLYQIVHPLHTGVYAMSPPPLRHDIDGFLAATKQGPARPQMSAEGAKM